MKKIFLESLAFFSNNISGGSNFISKHKEENNINFDSKLITPGYRRRISKPMYIAFLAAESALQNSGSCLQDINLVFSTSEIDLDIGEKNLIDLCTQEKDLSPKNFQNIVINATAGHLGIILKNTANSITLSSNKYHVAMALMHSAALLNNNNNLKVLLVSYDYPSSMICATKLNNYFACAFVFSSYESKNSLAHINFSLEKSSNFTSIRDPELEELREKVPAAQSLSLSANIIQKKSGTVFLSYGTELSLKANICF